MRLVDHVHSAGPDGTDGLVMLYAGPLTLVLSRSGRPQGWLFSLRVLLRIPRWSR